MLAASRPPSRAGNVDKIHFTLELILIRRRFAGDAPRLIAREQVRRRYPQHPSRHDECLQDGAGEIGMGKVGTHDPSEVQPRPRSILSDDYQPNL